MGEPIKESVTHAQIEHATDEHCPGFSNYRSSGVCLKLGVAAVRKGNQSNEFENGSSPTDNVPVWTKCIQTITWDRFHDK
jgi:hypothetical protein